jgi:hypothetical protein
MGSLELTGGFRFVGRCSLGIVLWGGLGVGRDIGSAVVQVLTLEKESTRGNLVQERPR